MARDRISIDGNYYKLAHKDLKPTGPPQWVQTKRASVPSDPGVPMEAQWQVWGSNLISFEGTSQQEEGYLGVDYTTNGDTRWEGMATVGPWLQTVTLSTYDGTATPTTALNMAVAWTDDTTAAYAYIIRGTPFAKVKLSDMTLVDPGQQLAHAATDVIFTLDASGAGEVSFAMGNANSYSTIKSITTGDDSGVYTAAPTGAVKADIFGQAPDRVVALIGTNTSNGALTVTGNVILGTTNMTAPAWNTITTIQSERMAATGFAMMTNYYVLGTSKGPYMLDTSVGRFFPLIPEIDNDPENCRQMTVWTFLGVIVPLHSGVRYQHWSDGVSWGTKRFYQNTSPVSGVATAHAGSTDWLYQAVKNESTGNSYLLAWRPRLQTDPHPNPMTPYVIGTLGANDCKFLDYVGTVSGLRSWRTLMGGYGTDAFYTTIGVTDREVDDSDYIYASHGTIYLTEMRRYPEMIKDLMAVEFTTANMNTGDKVQLQFSIDGGTAVSLDGGLTDDDGASVNGQVTNAGFHRQLFVDDGGQPLTWAHGRRVKPQIYIDNASNFSAPQVTGVLRLEFQLRPVMATVYQFSLVLDGALTLLSAAEAESALLAMWGSGPVRIDEDPDGESYYVRMESVSVQRVAETGGSQVSPGTGSIAVAQVVAVRWPGKAGE